MDFSEPVISVMEHAPFDGVVERAADWLISTRAHVGSRSLAAANSLGFDGEDAMQLAAKCATVLASVGVIGARNTLASLRARGPRRPRLDTPRVVRASNTVSVAATMYLVCRARFSPRGVEHKASHCLCPRVVLSQPLFVGRSLSSSQEVVSWSWNAVVHASRVSGVCDRAMWSRARAIVVEVSVDGTERAIPARCGVPVVALARPGVDPVGSYDGVLSV